mmetsp:Transcript_27641/g.56879  ORF Transcript_27641/g.56879 Transcript_27641/m.56879 type:complete len:364 (-) Transcript_27641:2268-3359(-)
MFIQKRKVQGANMFRIQNHRNINSISHLPIVILTRIHILECLMELIPCLQGLTVVPRLQTKCIRAHPIRHLPTQYAHPLDQRRVVLGPIKHQLFTLAGMMIAMKDLRRRANHRNNSNTIRTTLNTLTNHIRPRRDTTTVIPTTIPTTIPMDILLRIITTVIIHLPLEVKPIYQNTPKATTTEIGRLPFPTLETPGQLRSQCLNFIRTCHRLSPIRRKVPVSTTMATPHRAKTLHHERPVVSLGRHRQSTSRVTRNRSTKVVFPHPGRSPPLQPKKSKEVLDRYFVPLRRKFLVDTTTEGAAATVITTVSRRRNSEKSWTKQAHTKSYFRSPNLTTTAMPKIESGPGVREIVPPPSLMTPHLVL